MSELHDAESALIERLNFLITVAENNPLSGDIAQDALERLIAIAKSDTGQSRRVAEFLLAWWNAPNCGAFDLTALWGVDEHIVDDVIAVFNFIAQHPRCYPDMLGYDADFSEIIAQHRPELAAVE
ncbi:DUF7673 family protein [Tardiphaga sp. 841_E9_N1_2]|uniref:DUF7673 family protein n=1 Tax=Tardiphaga sp. 841_E9_N1_2 TaxID=3240762 RepID=UPI003F21BAEA